MTFPNWPVITKKQTHTLNTEKFLPFKAADEENNKVRQCCAGFLGNHDINDILQVSSAHEWKCILFQKCQIVEFIWVFFKYRLNRKRTSEGDVKHFFVKIIKTPAGTRSP